MSFPMASWQAGGQSPTGVWATGDRKRRATGVVLALPLAAAHAAQRIQERGEGGTELRRACVTS
jgi:hypothetical protein